MLFDFLRRIKKSESYLGIDIGTTSIKAVEIRKGKEKPELVNYAFFETYSHLERVNTALQTSTLKLFDEEIAKYLKLIIRKAGFSTDSVIASLPAFSAFTTLIEIPQMSQEDVNKTLKFKAKQYIPLPITSVTIDWIKVGEKIDDEGNKVQQIFLVSVPNEQVKKYQNIFQLAGLNLHTLEVEGFSLARVLTAASKEPTLIIDIGSRSSTFLIAQKGVLKLISQSDFAGSSLTQSISSGLGINIRRAEDLKKQKGLSGLGYGPDEELSTLLLPLLDVIINEAKRVKENYESSYKQKITSAVLTGGGANLLGIKKYFNKELDIPVSKVKPFESLSYPPKLEPLVDNLGPSFAVALGLGIKPYALKDN